MTPALYHELTDRQIFDCYLAPRDKENRLIPLRVRRPRIGDEPTGRPEAAATELPSVEDLQVPQEALLMGPPMSFVLMFWQVWRNRGLTTEKTFERWKSYLERENASQP